MEMDPDHVARFVAECVVVKGAGLVASGELYGCYRAYCAARDIRAVPLRWFPSVLESMGYRRWRSNGCRYFVGIELARHECGIYSPDSP